MSERVVTNLYTSVIFTFVLLLITSLEYCFAGKERIAEILSIELYGLLVLVLWSLNNEQACLIKQRFTNNCIKPTYVYYAFLGYCFYYVLKNTIGFLIIWKWHYVIMYIIFALGI